MTMYGDGGQSGFDPVGASMFNTFTGSATDANFQGGDPTKWVVTSGPLANAPESVQFYPPNIADNNPANEGYRFFGMQHVWRTTDNGGSQAYLEANCPEFTTSFADPACGDWEPLGATTLTTSTLGTLSGGTVAAVERCAGDTTTLWAATTTGRVFISTNANDATAANVTFTRLDTLSGGVAPGRFVSSIYVDPANGNHAWISYSGYNFNTPAQPGHVFEVTYNPAGPSATWTDLDGGTGPMGDLPVTDLVRDDVKGDLYASTDFGVLRLPSGFSIWVLAGTGTPAVEVAGITVANSARKLYAATHGRGIWSLQLP